MNNNLNLAIQTLASELKDNEDFFANWRDKIAEYVALSLGLDKRHPRKEELEMILTGANIFMHTLIQDAEAAQENNEYDSWLFNTKENLSKKYLDQNGIEY